MKKATSVGGLGAYMKNDDFSQGGAAVLMVVGAIVLFVGGIGLFLFGLVI
jgi:hypothetical protein